MTHPLGRSAIAQMLVRRERWPDGYKAKGIPLVSPGQQVAPDQPVLRIEYQGGEAAQAGGPVLKSSPPSTENRDSTPREGLPANGSLRTETALAGLRGRVVDITRRGGVVIESRAAVMQGAIGAGNQITGVLTMWQGGTGQIIPPKTILIVPGPLNLTMLRRAMNTGVAGIIGSSVSARDLEGFLATDLIQLLDEDDIEYAQAQLPPMTLLFTEGLGNISMPARVMNLLSQYQGTMVLLSGATSIRQGIFPEVVISLPTQEVQEQHNSVPPSTALALGAQVRVCGGEHQGAIGVVDYFFAHQQVFAAGTRARAIRLRLEDGTLLVVPTVLVERIG